MKLDKYILLQKVTKILASIVLLYLLQTMLEQITPYVELTSIKCWGCIVQCLDLQAQESLVLLQH